MELRELIAGTNLLHWILLSVFCLAFLIQMAYILLVFIRLPISKKKEVSTSDAGISVIICAKNEEKNLEQFLPKILEQDYPLFEVVVVNDSSTDETEQLLSRMLANHNNLRYTSIPASDKLMRGKKLALTIGLKAAKYEQIMLTDADCYPVSNQWLKTMSSNFSQEKRIVLGYGGYERKRGLLNSLIRYETVFTAIQYLSYAIKGQPYMGVGRNLAYHKSLFFETRGFASHYHILSGDDDLFVNENANRSNTVVECSTESHTRSLPEVTLRGWIKQKKRHLSAGRHYRRGSRIRLAFEWISRILLYACLIWLAVASSWIWPVMAVFGVLLLSRLIIFKLGMRRLNEKYLLLPSLLFDPLMPLILGAIWFSSLFETKYEPWR